MRHGLVTRTINAMFDYANFDLCWVDRCRNDGLGTHRLVGEKIDEVEYVGRCAGVVAGGMRRWWRRCQFHATSHGPRLHAGQHRSAAGRPERACGCLSGLQRHRDGRWPGLPVARSTDAVVNWTEIGAANAPSYAVTVADASLHDSRYRVVVSGSANSVTSSAVRLTVTVALDARSRA